MKCLSPPYRSAGRGKTRESLNNYAAGGRERKRLKISLSLVRRVRIVKRRYGGRGKALILCWLIPFVPPSFLSRRSPMQNCSSSSSSLSYEKYCFWRVRTAASLIRVPTMLVATLLSPSRWLHANCDSRLRHLLHK